MFVPERLLSCKGRNRKVGRPCASEVPTFEHIVAVHERMVYRLAYRFVGNPHDASDVAQETFLRVHRALPKFRGEAALSTWIHTITANTARNFLRAKKSRERHQVLTFPDRNEPVRPDIFERQPDRETANPARIAESGELGERIQRALMRLPESFREAVVLRDLEGLDYGQIAKRLRVSEGTIKSRIARGRSILRILMKRDLFDIPA